MELVPPWAIKIVIDDVIQTKRTELLPAALGEYRVAPAVASAVLRSFVPAT